MTGCFRHAPLALRNIRTLGVIIIIIIFIRFEILFRSQGIPVNHDKSVERNKTESGFGVYDFSGLVRLLLEMQAI